MKILALDISTQTGYCLLEDDKVLESGTLSVSKRPHDYKLDYPSDVSAFCMDVSLGIYRQVLSILSKYGKMDLLIIEETTSSRSNQTQRILEWIHLMVLNMLDEKKIIPKYVKTGEWRKVLELRLSKEDKLNNKEVNKGIKRGKINKKHLAVRLATELTGQKFKMKDNNTCDAICIAYAAAKGVEYVTYNNRKDSTTT